MLHAYVSFLYAIRREVHLANTETRHDAILAQCVCVMNTAHVFVAEICSH